jgi:hypothetical protein
MEARVEYDFVTGGHRVWLYERGFGGLKVIRFEYRIDEHGNLLPPWTVWEDVDPHSEVKPTLILPRDGLEALMVAAGEHVKATDATVDALADARSVRDRMITLVENAHPRLDRS